MTRQGIERLYFGLTMVIFFVPVLRVNRILGIPTTTPHPPPSPFHTGPREASTRRARVRVHGAPLITRRSCERRAAHASGARLLQAAQRGRAP